MSHYDKARQADNELREQEALSRRKRVYQEVAPLLAELNGLIIRTRYTVNDEAYVHLKQKLRELSALFKDYTS